MDENSLQSLVIQANFLGSYEIKGNNCVVGGLATQKNRALAAYLIIEQEHEHARTKVAGLLWPDVPEETALHNLRQALSVVRKAFEPCGGGEVFTASRDTINFHAGTKITTDVFEFESQMRAMIERFHRQQGRGFPILRLKRTLALYKGELLESLALTDAELFSDWLVLRREALDRLAVEGTSLLLRYYETRCEWGEARKTAERLVSLAPWDENAHSRFINVLLQLAQGNAALTHYQAAQRYFDQELGVEPEHQLKQASEDIHRFFASGRSEPRQTSALVKLPGYSTPFIGRAQELETLEDWAADPACRLITITGAGGSGKTRLAAKLAESQHTLFAGGVFFVSIAGCAGTERLSATILNAVSGLGEKSSDPLQELLAWAKNRRTLLILDNVEGCEDAAALAANLMEAAAQVVLVFTSYTRLDLVGERVFALKGLSSQEGSGSEAVSLFFAHVQPESLPESTTPQFIDNVVRICRLVEGLPLAIDLAAGQVRRIASDELLAGLETSMDLLRSGAVNLPERHRSITASFENCWKYLSLVQRHTLSLLTVFRSPFTLAAALQVCGVSATDVRDLAAQALLIWDGSEHYRFHRAISQYASEKLHLTASEGEQLEEQHARWFYQKLMEDYAGFAGEGILAYLRNTEAVMPDVVKAARSLIKNGDWERMQTVIHPLYSYFEARSLFREGSLLLLELAELCVPNGAGQRCRARLAARAASLQINLQQFATVPALLESSLVVAQAEGDTAEVSYVFNVKAKLAAVNKSSSVSLEYAQSALRLARSVRDKSEIAHGLYNLGYALINQGEITKAESVLQECRAICEELGDWRRLSKVLNILADAVCYRGDYVQALAFYADALKIATALANSYSESLVLNNIGAAYYSLEDFAAAEENYHKSLQVCREIDDREGEAIALSNLGEVFAHNQEYQKGAEYNQHALIISLEIGSDWSELSARVILASCYRELGKGEAAQQEVVIALERSIELEFMYFFNRAVVEACQILRVRGQTDGLAQILSEITQDEESDDWISAMAKAVQEKLPANGTTTGGYSDRRAMLDFLVKALQQ